MELPKCDDDKLVYSFIREATVNIVKMIKSKEFMSDFKEGQKRFGEDVATLVNSILLTFVYIIGVGSTSLIAKCFRKKFLDLKQDKNKKSYWEDLNSTKRPIEEYYRQF